jgi:LuxR family maltose regulon positive regulatory protein
VPAPLLATKFLPPLPAKYLVDRPRLLQILEGCLRPGCRLTLVAAPAGFGKTTLVSAWVAAAAPRPEPPMVARLSLDEQDHDPVRFWAYVCAALTPKNGVLTRGLRELLDVAQTPIFNRRSRC